MRKVTIKDIAEEAGVSKATVSRVLNHGDIVEEKTRIKVEKVMKKYKYSPSRLARSLVNQETNTIGIIIPEIDNSFYGRILRTIVRLADDEELVPICLDTDNDPQKDIKSLKILIDQQVSGIIYAPSVEYGENKDVNAAYKILRGNNIPTVLLDRKVPKFNSPGVYFENYRASYESTKILLGAGHRKIAVIGGSQKIGIARERLEGYKKAFTDFGVDMDEQYMFEGDFTATTAYGLSIRMLAMKALPTAVLTLNNGSSLGFLQAAAEKGVHVPTDMEHIGIDEIDAFDYMHMPYNHVTRSRTEMAASAMEQLLKLMKGDEETVEDVLIEPRFVLGSHLEKVAKKYLII